MAGRATFHMRRWRRSNPRRQQLICVAHHGTTTFSRLSSGRPQRKSGATPGATGSRSSNRAGGQLPITGTSSFLFRSRRQARKRCVARRYLCMRFAGFNTGQVGADARNQLDFAVLLTSLH